MLTDSKLLNNARELRRNMTKEERKLWYSFLRAHPASFRRQFIIDPYILDFYCPQVKLAIEIDGGQHYSEKGMEHDTNRTKWLEDKGVRVLRFLNTDITNRFKYVCENIDEVVSGRR